jgi:hypothetical protein
MNIFKLLGGIYEELKTLNKNLEGLSGFNSSAETVPLLRKLAKEADYRLGLDEKRQRESLNPLLEMTDIERLELKLWIKNQIKAKGYSIDDIPLNEGYVKNSAIKFMESANKSSSAPVRNALSVCLGYASFYDLVEDWRKTATALKGGKA